MEEIFDTLLKTYGTQGWWPLSKGSQYSRHHKGKPENDTDRFEIIVGAILTQNTSWKNVEKALYNLNRKKLIDAKRMAAARKGLIASCIRPAGYYNQKAERLKIAAKYFLAHKNLSGKNAKELRDALLKVNGIGPETADSIALYAFGKPSFVIDAYTKRIFSRLGFCDEKAVKYDELQKMFEGRLPSNTRLFKEYHALIVEHAKQHCHKKPSCESCTLRKRCNHPAKL